MLVCMSANVFASTNVDVSANSGIDVEQAYNLAEGFLKEYYYALHIFEDYDFTAYIASQALLEHINGRIQSSWNSESLILDSQRLEYEMETELVSSEDLGDCLRLFVAVRSSWRYIDVDFRSGNGDGVYLLIADSGDGLKIYDWYIPHEPYLEATRGAFDTVSDKDFWGTSSEAAKILANQKEWDADIPARASIINAQKAGTSVEEHNESELEPALTNATLSPLNKESIVDWARDNYISSPPSSGNPDLVSTYYDFSTLTNQFDCTNFASHALLAGGAVLNKTSTSGSTAWYYVSLSDRTSSWAGVDKFYSFLTHNKTLGPAGKKYAYAAGSENFELGDIIQFRSKYEVSENEWTHTTIITMEENNETYVTGRSSSTSYNDNDKVSTLSNSYSGGTRVIHLTGNYK